MLPQNALQASQDECEDFVDTWKCVFGEKKWNAN